MVATVVSEGLQALRIEKDLFIGAPLDIAFESLLEELGPESQLPDGKPMPMVLEPRPGGRWFRDLGSDAGHLWGHVQVIKPPTLIEICGPLFMSYPALNHVQYKLTAEGTGTRLRFLHRGYGELAIEHREGVNEGWGFRLNRIKQVAEAKMIA